MAKLAIYHDEARRKYVEEGFSIEAIAGMLGGKVSAKTLYGWKKDNCWDDKRREYLNQAKGLRNEIMEIARMTVREAKAKPTPHNIYAMTKAIAALKQFDGIKIIEDETTPAERQKIVKEFSPESIDYIKKVLYGLPS